MFFIPLILLGIILISPDVLACSQVHPVAAFIHINDRNHDRALDFYEWQNATAGHNLIVNFSLNDTRTFVQHDIDKNGLVEASELGFHSVQYKQEPCAQRSTQKRYLQGAKMFMATH